MQFIHIIHAAENWNEKSSLHVWYNSFFIETELNISVGVGAGVGVGYDDNSDDKFPIV